MCQEVIYTSEDCEHESVVLEECGSPSCVGRSRTAGPKLPGRCLQCTGEEPRPEPVFYKWCLISTVCDHEFAHTITDVERDPHAPEHVLTDASPALCPACAAHGLDQRPPASQAPPAAFADLPRTARASVAPPLSAALRSSPPVAASLPRAAPSVHASVDFASGRRIAGARRGAFATSTAMPRAAAQSGGTSVAPPPFQTLDPMMLNRGEGQGGSMRAPRGEREVDLGDIYEED